MSLILKFLDDRQREDFLRIVKAERPDLLARLVLNPALPQVVARTSLAEDVWLRERVASHGRAFSDIPFQAFAG